MNLENRDLGDDYVNGTTWEMLPGLPELKIPPPTTTGECGTAVLYKFTPPACIKTVRFQITSNGDKYIFAVTDAYDALTGKCTHGGDDIIYAHLFSRSLVLSFFRSLVLSFTRSLVLSFSRSLLHSFSRSLVLSLARSVVRSFSLSLGLSYPLTRFLTHSHTHSLTLSFSLSLSLSLSLSHTLSHTHSLISTSEI